MRLRWYDWLLVPGVAALIYVTTAVVGNSILHAQTPMPEGGMSVEGTGHVTLACDTTRLGASATWDTTPGLVGWQRWVRASITYKVKIHDGLDWVNQDSIGMRCLYQWSNLGLAESWFTKDSSAVIHDTLYHTDTMVVWPYRYFRIIGHTDTTLALPKQAQGYRQVCGFSIFPVEK